MPRCKVFEARGVQPVLPENGVVFCLQCFNRRKVIEHAALTSLMNSTRTVGRDDVAHFNGGLSVAYDGFMCGLPLDHRPCYSSALLGNGLQGQPLEGRCCPAFVSDAGQRLDALDSLGLPFL